MNNRVNTYEQLLTRLVTESDTAQVLRYLALQDTAQTALQVALAEGADVARTITDRVIDIIEALSAEEDIAVIERAAQDSTVVRALVETYGDDE